MEINGWHYDYEKLPYWDIRDRFSYVFDELYENEQSDTACLIYSIAEVSMCNEVRCLAVLRQKSSPELMINVTSFHFPRQHVCYSLNGKYIFLKAHVYVEAENRILCPIIIIDLFNDKFASADIHANTTCSTFKELNSNQILVTTPLIKKEHEDVLFMFSQLKWFPILELNQFQF